MQNSKVILFGEYALLEGALGLAIPLPEFSGRLVFPDVPVLTPGQIYSNRVLVNITDWIENHSFHFPCRLQALKPDIQKGLYFESTIPEGYGLGSSGALVAALFKQYFQWAGKNTDLNFLRDDLATLESYFHGKSSGTDPLVSFLNQPVLLNSSGYSKPFAFPDSISPFLIDMGIISKTKGLVTLFLERAVNEPILYQQFIQLNNRCVDEFINHSPHVYQTIQEFCQLEQQFLPEMFPSKALIQETSRHFSGQVAIKLCGSGGGGFLLGFTNSIPFAVIDAYFQSKKLQTTKIQAESIPGYGADLLMC